MKKLSGLIFFALFLLSLIQSSKAQMYDGRYFNRNGVFLEILGNGNMYSLNYERLIKDAGRVKHGWRLGGGYSPIAIGKTGKISLLDVPLEYNFFFLRKKHHPEIGLGFTYERLSIKSIIPETHYNTSVTITSTDTIITISKEEHEHVQKLITTRFMIVPRIGYRYEKPNGRLSIRVGFTPLITVYGIAKTTLDGETIAKSPTGFSIQWWGGIAIGYKWDY
jgi:hypothetical protein